MDFITFKSISQRLPSDISVLLRGRHGIGKSEVIYQVAQEFNLPVMERRLSQITEGDMIGLPYKVEKKDQNGELKSISTRFLPLDWFIECIESPHLIFLDELDRSSQEVQQAAFELVLDRSIQGNKIHPESRIYAAINGGTEGGSNYHTNDIDPALLDRFWTADITPSVEEWLMWAQGKVVPDIIEFIRSEQAHLENNEVIDPGKIYPSRRSWKRLSDTFKINPDLITDLKNNQPLFISMCSGFVGIEATSMFRQFMLNKNKSYTALDVLDRFDHFKGQFANLKIEEQNNIIDKLYDDSINLEKGLWTKNQSENVAQFFKLLAKEIQMSMWDKLSRTECKRENILLFANLVKSIILSNCS